MRLLVSLPLMLAGASAIAASTSRAPVGHASSAPAVHADSAREFRGFYQTGFEVSWFRPCDAPPGDDLWWVTLSDEALRQRDSLAKRLTGQPRSVFVRWRGTTSAKMPAGHMGQGSRYLLVSTILELRSADEAGCSAT